MLADGCVMPTYLIYYSKEEGKKWLMEDCVWQSCVTGAFCCMSGFGTSSLLRATSQLQTCNKIPGHVHFMIRRCYWMFDASLCN